MIYPLRNYTIKGFLWYQGEHNVPEYNDYAEMMSKLVNVWRTIWGDQKLPFYFVQIPGWSYFNHPEGIERPLFVENQKKALDLIPYSDMATTTDIGEEHCIHPTHKREVGQRLAACALYRTYGIPGIYSDVIHVKEVTYDKNTATVTWTGNSFGMSARHIDGFELAGEDRIFHTAQAMVVKGSIRVSSQEVEQPVAVRYAFHNYIKANLCNSLGVPYCSFRTDHW
jgi:sialate O-acetylesterase